MLEPERGCRLLSCGPLLAEDGGVHTYLVAAFADTPFTGNPAAVCVLQSNLPGSTLQSIAREMNQPITTFLQRREGGWAVRWFSSTMEVGLCGHATLAAAHALWAADHAPAGTSIRFNGPNVVLFARKEEDLIWIDLPAIPGRSAQPPAELIDCVGSKPVATALHADRWIFEYAAADEVRSITPDFEALRRTGARALIVTSRSDLTGYDIISRNFPPLIGINEDHVTGAAHACLAPYWNSRLGPELHCWQASSRGGGLITRHRAKRVELGGRAVLQLSGSWLAEGLPRQHVD